jgi:hypothetical protein
MHGDISGRNPVVRARRHNKHPMRSFTLYIALMLPVGSGLDAADIKIGMVGLDTSHVIAFTKILHDRCFSASALRFGQGTQAVRGGKIGRVLRAETNSPAALEPHHIDLFWYGIHGVESLFTVMGTGIESVSRRNSTPGALETVGQWSGGRTGTFREIKGYGGRAMGETGESEVGKFDGYAPLVAAIVTFFKTGIPPVSEQETLEILAFMEADALSKERGGTTVEIAEVMQRAGWETPASAR